MKINRDIIIGMGISFLLHVVTLVALSFIVFKGPMDKLQMVLDSVFDQERVHEEFTQEVEQSTVAADTVNYVAGSMAAGMTGTGGTAGPVVATQKVDEAPSLREPDVKVNIGSMSAQFRMASMAARNSSTTDRPTQCGSNAFHV